MAEPEVRHIDFATLALAHKMLTHDQVDELSKCVQKNPAKKMEDFAFELGYITKEELWALQKAQERMIRDAHGGGRRIGQYEILNVVGEGGLGIVYRARQLSMGRIVALKALHQRWSSDNEFRQRFLVEARLLGRLSHNNLIQVYDVGQSRDIYYYSMEYIDGETIEKRIQRLGKMPPESTLEIAIQIAKALQYLSHHKLVHRDVKPSNIMMTRRDVAKLGDFGFVKSSLDSVMSQTGEVLGTPDYISPECAEGRNDLDARSDIYSLGASMYHMLTGKPPFSGTASKVMSSHVHIAPPQLITLAEDIPDELVRLVDKMMAKSRDDRHSNLDALLADMHVVMTHIRPSGTQTVQLLMKEQQTREVVLRDEILKLQDRIKRLWILFGISVIMIIVLLILCIFRL